jgi:signal transduction histidine kinase
MRIPPLRLAHKLFLGFALVGVVVAALAGWTLLVTDRLTEENRAILQDTLPAVRLEVSLLESVAALRRLESRHAILRDPAYLQLFRERAQALGADLARLGPSLATPAEQATLAEARTRLADYRAQVERRPGPSPPGEPPVARLEAALEQLYSTSAVELHRREATARVLHRQTRVVAGTGIALSLAVGLLVACGTTLLVARPLRRLRAAAGDVARHAFPEPIPVRGRDEVAELTRAFNQMATRLQEVDAFKEEFLSTVSHDLRTPLAAIRWSADLLQGGVPAAISPKQARLVENIKSSANRLLGLVDQLLDLGKLEAGRLELDPRPGDLLALARASVAEVQPLADQGRIQLEITEGAGVPPILADPDRLQQVLVNLLGNALKFTPAGGRVSVEVGVEGREAVVRVRDTGIGIPPALLPSIFDRYRQAHRGRGGTGIGLTVVKGLVEAHRGRVWVESEENRGSCFGVALPLAEAAREARAVARRAG